MPYPIQRLFSVLLGILSILAASPASSADPPVAIAIHGGAGTLSRDTIDAAQEAALRERLRAAVTAGHQVLVSGGTSIEAITVAIRLLEDSPLFNAGRGAVFNADGQIELDASIMAGATRQAGAVAAVRRVRNPIDLALAVLRESPHVLLIGAGAEAFARDQGMKLVEPEYFHTDFRRQQLEEARGREAAGHAPGAAAFYSTVGAVALDRHGDLAAGTSTGGMTNKRFGRVGDSPIIGAGTFADNGSCAVSGTGHGEFFIRWVVAYEICRRVADGASVLEAAESVVNGVLAAAGGAGGVIAMDPTGAIAMPFNTEGMYRAAISTTGEVDVRIYRDD
jgi:beta-aspartyl-peptidase (threonine type)